MTNCFARGFKSLRESVLHANQFLSMPRYVDFRSNEIHYQYSQLNLQTIEMPTKKVIKKKMEPEKAIEKKVIVTSLAHLAGFHFYVEETKSGPYVDPFSTPPREYYVEDENRKKRVPLADALKFGMVEGVDIPNIMWEFIHEYDKNMD